MNEKTPRTGIVEPLFPDWAGPVYLVVGLVIGTVYFLFDLVIVSMPGMALFKALGIVFLAAYALFSRHFALALALALSACGDYALALEPQEQVAGIGFFAAAHIVYALIFARIILTDGVRKEGLILLGAISFYGAALWLWLRPDLGVMTLPVSAYIAIILAMAGTAVVSRAGSWVVVGALLFMGSDSLIALGWFKGFSVTGFGLDLYGGAIWASYFAAQACLAYGLVKRGKTR